MAKKAYKSTRPKRDYLDELIQKDPPVTFRQTRNPDHFYWEELARAKKQEIIDLVGEVVCDKAIDEEYPLIFTWKNCSNMMIRIYDRFVKERCSHKEFHNAPGAAKRYICKECGYATNDPPVIEAAPEKQRGHKIYSAGVGTMLARDYVCSVCWGMLFHKFVPEGKKQISVVSCLNDNCDGEGFVTLAYAERRRKESRLELWEVKINLGKALGLNPYK